MGFRFRRSIKILPGLRLNLSRSGVSASVGVRGAHVTIGHGQVRETVGLPGTGISYTESQSLETHAEAPGAAPAADAPKPRAWRGWLWIALAIAVLAIVAYSVAKAAESSPVVPEVYNVKPPEPDHRGTAQQPLIIQQPADPEHARNERETAQSTIGLAVLTGLLFLANLWLIIEARHVSTRQANETKQSLEVQARSALAMRDVADATKNNAVLMSAMLSKQMRAYLTIEIGSAVYQDEHLRFEASPLLTNNGLTPARNVCFRVMADILDGSSGPPKLADIEELIVNDMGLAPRQSVNTSKVIAYRIPDSEVAEVMAGTSRRLYAWGRVTYEDVFGAHWETKFCFSYYFPKVGDRFTVRGNYNALHNNAT